MHRKRQQGQSTLGLLAVLAFGAGAALADENSRTTLSAGYDFSSGEYGTATTTDIATLALSALHERGPWALKLTVPYLQVTGDGSVLASGRGRRATTVAATTRTTNSGLGDVMAMVSYQLHSSDDQASGLAVAGRVKFGTANKTLGTGKNDYAAQLYGYHALGDFTPSLVLGYEVLGSSAEVPLDDVYYGTAVGDYRFGELSNGGIEYRYVQRASATAAERRELVLYVNREIRRDTFLRAYLLQGYADGSPDSGFGIAISAGY